MTAFNRLTVVAKIDANGIADLIESILLHKSLYSIFNNYIEGVKGNNKFTKSSSLVKKEYNDVLKNLIDKADKVFKQLKEERKRSKEGSIIDVLETRLKDSLKNFKEIK